MRPLLRSRFAVVCAAVTAHVALAGPMDPASAAPSARVVVIGLDGAISVAAARHITRAVEQARRENASAVVIRLDTPGGLVSATRDIIRDIISAQIPIIVYVA